MPDSCQPSCVAARREAALKVLKFGGKLDLIRLAKGATLAELAVKSGVPERTVERICAGHNAPSAAHFVRLVRALDISLDAIEPEDLEGEELP